MLLILLGVVTGCGKATRTGGGSARRPNIFLVTIESVRADHVGCYHGYLPTAPALDALSREGITFENFYTVSSWTLAAHASLFTGFYPTAANVVLPKDRLDTSYATMAELLAESGYLTAGVVSGPYLRRSFQLNRGFQEYDEEAAAPPKTHATKDITNPQVEAKLKAFLREHANDEQPFFLFGYLWDPHYDYIPPEPYNTMFVPSNAVPIDVSNYDNSRSKVNKDISREELAYVISQYDGEIRCTDDALGRVFDTMKELGLWDDTVVIVVADHGEEFFDHGKKGHKNNLFAESMLVPCVIKPAGSTVPKRDPRLASMVDLYPTVLEFGQVKGPLPDHQGHSLLAPDPGVPIYGELVTSWYLTDEKTQERTLDPTFWWSLRDGALRVIGMKNERKNKEWWGLYDCEADPRERSPLGAEYAEQLEDMKSRALAWDRRMKDTAAKQGTRSQADLSPEEIEQLRSIGYLR